MLRYFLLIGLYFAWAVSFSQTFLDGQLKYMTVQEAKITKDSILQSEFQAQDLTYPPNNILIQVYKSEADLELWVQSKAGDPYELFKTYSICDMSGTIGPKRRLGDQQVPEGFYNLSLFNPESSYFLSMKVSYPNESDAVFSDSLKPGGNIYLHGACGSLGCIAIGDDQIAEVYWLAAQARSKTRTSPPIYIYPAKLSDFKYELLCSMSGQNQSNLKLWQNLKRGYDKFLMDYKLLNYTVNKEGDYVFD